MSNWQISLPETAVEGAPTHVEDHNQIISALREIRDNVDSVETTPGPKGDKSDPGNPGAPGNDGFPTEAQWNDLVARVESLETPEDPA